MKTQPVTIRIIDAMHKEIGYVAEVEGKTFAEVIRSSLTSYLTNRRTNNFENALTVLIQNIGMEIRSQSLKVDSITSAIDELKLRLDDFETTT
jgi:hypothetical protein